MPTHNQSDANISPGEAARSSLDADPGENSSSHLQLQVAHLLFTDMVGYPLLPMDRQTELMQRLQKMVSKTA